MKTSLQLPITLAYAKGAYTTRISLGSAGQHAHVLLDSGSSTLAVLPHVYDSERDRSLQATALAQAVTYGAGAWAGPVLQSELAFGEGAHARRLPDAQFAVIQTPAPDWRGADGILGLAYRGLDLAPDSSALLEAQQTSPALTWPWPFNTDSPAAISSFKAELHQQPAVTVTPVFSALELEGVVNDKFAMLIQRALVHVTDDASSAAALAADPLNQGTLVLGGGEECQSLYEGGFESVQIVHDLYYNAHLAAIRIGNQPAVPAPPLQAEYESSYASNAIIDTGSSFLVLQASLYDAVLAAFATHNPALSKLIADFQQRFASGHGLPNTRINDADWPDLHFQLQAADGGVVNLRCQASHYWQRNALFAGESFFLLLRQLASWPNQSILGLPLLCGRYCVFDRRSAGTGVLRLAKARAAVR